MATMRKAVDAIGGEPLPHGILSGCADVRDVTDPHELLGVDWLALGCCPVQAWVDPCLSDSSPGDASPGDTSPGDVSPGDPAEKEFCRPTVEAADPFTVYAGVECSAPGWSYPEAVQHARAALELGEQQAVEEGFMRQHLSPQAVDLTPPEGPLSLAQGLAALEGCLAESYGGRGVVHVPAGAAALLGCCQLAHPTPDGGLFTLAGNCLVIGAGYSAVNVGPDGLPAEPGTAWLYITGPVTVRRGPVDIIPDPSRAASSVNTRTNDRQVLAERTYVVATTCTVCAVKVTLCP